MVVSQRDGLRKDTRSEAKVTNRRPDVEPPRRAPHTDTAAPGAPGHEAAQQGGARRSWRPLRGVLRLRTFAALRHREFLSALVRAGGHGHGDVDGSGGPWVAHV